MIKHFKQQQQIDLARLARSVVVVALFGLAVYFAYNFYPFIILALHVDLPSYTLHNADYIRSINDPFAYRSVFPPNHTAEASYPTYFALGELLAAWPANHVEIDGWIHSRSYPSKSNGLYRLNYMNPSENALAHKLYDQELPFILYNVPDLDKAAENQFSLSSMQKSFGDTQFTVEKSHSNEFLYYMVKNLDATLLHYPDWKPPQEHVQMTFGQFIRAADRARSYNLSVPGAGRDFHYLTLSAVAGGKLDWISTALPFFQRKDSLFVKVDQPYHGIKCRLGMKGIIAASHFDGNRNFIAMIRGRKRYILSPPEECKHMQLYPRKHPSARHSSVSWSSLDEMKKYPHLYNARAVEVLVKAGELLYIPSYWFHYIVSQDASIQCNCRSGESAKSRQVISECGFGRVRALADEIRND